MSGLEKSLLNLKFTAKQLNRQAQKAGKDETVEKGKLKKVGKTLSILSSTHIKRGGTMVALSKDAHAPSR